MGKHHHHPHEGHSPGNPPGTRRRQGPFFYLAGAAILLALICFIIWGSFAGSRTVAPTATVDPAAAPASSSPATR